MSLRTKILGNNDSKTVDVLKNSYTANGLVTISYPGIIETNGGGFFTNSVYGADMNIDGSTSGVENIHNGADHTYWTAAAGAGTWNFSSTTVAYSGSQSIDATAAVDNDFAVFTRSSTLELNNHVSFKGAIYISSWSTAGTDKDVRVFFRNSGTPVTDEFQLKSVIDIGTVGSWQLFDIPLESFNVTSPTADELVVRIVDTGAGAPPDVYLDNLQLSLSGSPAIFSFGPGVGVKWRVNNIQNTIVDAYTSTLTDGTMSKIPYNGFLGVSTLTNGIVNRRIQNEQVRFSTVYRDFINLIEAPGETQIICGSDGTNTWVKRVQKFPGYVELDGTLNDRFEYVISDDLSGLIRFRTACNYQIISIDPEI